MYPNSHFTDHSTFSISSSTTSISSEPLNSDSRMDSDRLPIGSGGKTSRSAVSQAIEKSSSSPARVLSGLATGFTFAARVLATIVGVALYGAAMVASGILTGVSYFLLVIPGGVGEIVGVGVGGLYKAIAGVGDNTPFEDDPLIKGGKIGREVPWAVLQVGLGVPRALCAGVGLVGAGLLAFGLKKEFKTFSEPIKDANYDLSIRLKELRLIEYNYSIEYKY